MRDLFFLIRLPFFLLRVVLIAVIGLPLLLIMYFIFLAVEILWTLPIEFVLAAFRDSPEHFQKKVEEFKEGRRVLGGSYWEMFTEAWDWLHGRG